MPYWSGAPLDSQLTRLRTARLGVEGTWNANWAYKAEASFGAGNSVQWEDLILEYKPGDFSSIMLGAFFGVTVVAYLLGAINTGVAAGIGQIAFAAATVFVLVRR